MERANIIRGIITSKTGGTVAGLIVQAYSMGVRQKELLGEAVTDRTGAYHIAWTRPVPSREQAGHAAVHIGLAVSTPGKAILFSAGPDDIRFNAGRIEEINVTITKTIKPETVEYADILAALAAAGVTADQLEENDDHHDVTMLARTSSVPAEKIEHAVLAQRLEQRSNIEAPFFYALLRQNTLLKNDLAKPLHLQFSIGINADPQGVLYDAALADPQLVQRDIAQAIKDKMIGGLADAAVQRHLKTLAGLKADAEAYVADERMQRLTDVVTQFVLQDKIGEAAKLFKSNKHDLTGVLKKVANVKFLGNVGKVRDLKTTLALGELVGYDQAIINQIGKAHAITKPTDIRRLAKLDKTAWKTELLKSADKVTIGGKHIDKKLIDLHASSLTRKLEKAYPTQAFVAQLERETKPVLKHQKEITTLLTKHEDFDLQTSNIDLFFSDKKLAAKEHQTTREELKKIQRVFRLTPNYGKANALLGQNVASAHDITAIGKANFLKQVAPAAGLSAKEANAMYAKAEATSTAAMIVAGELQDISAAAPIPAFNTLKLGKKIEGVTTDFPNLQALFKTGDTCACDHCRSVYGPAAYLVELLEFVDKRSVTDLTVTPHVTTNKAQDVLFARRPDLGEIDLSCANAMTPMPYIDLANEQLEELIAPDTGITYSGKLSGGSDSLVGNIAPSLLTALVAKGISITDKAQIFATETTGSSATLPHYIRDKKAVLKAVHAGGNNYKIYHLRQTLSSAEELAAAPDYVNTEAYTALASHAYAFGLPFDLNHTEARAYFERFDIDRAALMQTFQVGATPANEVIAAEMLGLTAAERALITAPDAANQQDYWNTTSSPATELKVVSTFLNKTGLSYEELMRLLTLTFIDPADKLFIKHLDLSCDLTQKEIANLDNAALDRIHRFLRLQKKTGWKLETLDEVISQSNLGAGQLSDTTLQIVAELMQLAKDTGLKVDELVGGFGYLAHEDIDGRPDKPLYHQIFLNKAKNGTIDQALLPEKINGSSFLADVAASLAVSLQVKESELPTLFMQLVDNKLTFENLSYLFLLTRLMRKLKLKAAELDILIDLTGTNPTTSPADALTFTRDARAAKEQPLKLAAIRYMLYHQAEDITALELKDEIIQKELESLQAAYQAAYAATKSPFDPNLTANEQMEALAKQLGQLPQVAEKDIKALAGFLHREWASPVAAKTLVDNLFSSLFDTTGIKAAIDALAAVAPNGDITQESKDLLQALMEALAGHQFLAAKRTTLQTHISSAFKADLDTASVVLARTILKQPAPGTAALQDILLDNNLIDTLNPIPVPPAISEAAFGQHYKSLRLLHKLLPLISSYGLAPETIDWLLAHSADLDWLAWDAIPYQSGHAEVAYEKYAELTRLLQLASQLPPVVNPTDATRPITFWSVLEMTLPGNTATRNQFLEHLSLLTGYEKAILDEIDAHFFAAFDITQYRKVAVPERMFKATEYARKLAGTMQNIVAYVKPTLVAADAAALRLSLKSRYDETTWLETLKEIMDAIRPQKRDALVAYLLATRPEFKSENDLYDYLLIDVEMEACMPSSRIVQAHGTIQLFVQRCLMGLEPEAAADTENDSGWEQWKWLKLYRVREVNHKIFLYPENWIEAELRDDKSFIFAELENELQQNELTEFTAERALTSYLERLDGLAFLEVVATWYQTNIKTMHVFARSKGGDPAIYYHRKFEQERAWTPWSKVEVEITGDHLLAFERNNRLTLAWPVFSEEPDPNPQSTVPNSTPGTIVSSDKPKRKLKIQLAVSEFADNMWQPKRISQSAIRTPGYYTNEDLQQYAYNLIYIEAMDQILVLKGLGQDYTELRGVFDVAGCKGYPELAQEGQSYFPDFFPDFKDTILNTQRYWERNLDATPDLAARTALAPFNFYEILGQTPDNFRLTYPHQMTLIDWVALLLQYFLYAAHSNRASSVGHEGRFKIPLGTLLPYFMEDSSHAYVITPGFYEREKREGRGGAGDLTAEESTAVVQRTASNVLQLIEDIIALYKKYLAKLQSGQSPASVIQELLADEDYHDIVAELKVYGGLRYGEKFSNMYHPLICALRKVLYKEGIPALMKRPVQLQQTNFNFGTHYDPSAIVPQKYPIEDIDFASDGSYSSYNWELFFHVPMMIATQLTRNQKFEEAMDWFHYIFNPTGALPGDVPQKYWVNKPFFLRNDSEYIAQRIDTLLYKIADPNTPEIKELEFAIQQWREKPFRPHVVARFRTVAYQKAILMKYIGNLVEWGDYLFRQDTMESIAQATQMYVMADKLLGPKPRIVPPVVQPPNETYNQIQAKLGPLGNALIDLENILPDLSVLPEGGTEMPPAPITLSTLYFCIPQNEQMLAYWDRIADRLFKIRNCQNIEGIERSLALFAPPIDPAMLVRAAAAGLDLSSIIAGLNAPLPYYRFSVLSQKASDLANEVRSLGGSLLQALEKKDAEELSLLRSEQEISVLNAVTAIKKLGIAEATEQIEVLKRTRKVTEERQKFYAEVEKINAKEQLNLDKLEESHDLQLGAQISRTLAGVVAMIPDLLGGASGFGGSPHVTLQWGGKNLAAAANSAADVLNIFSSIATYEAGRAATLGSYDRRMDDWKLQERTSQKEIDSINKQIVAAEIRKELAETELKNHELQIKNAKQTDEYMRSKFTNEELYQWMIGQISSIYFSSYKLAHDTAKKAERTYQFELGRDDSYIAFGYWDSMKKGLQCADHLIHDIKRMEAGYLDRNKREYEVTKQISLAALDPLALARLRATGVCDFDVPEALFDMDHAGQYFRRIKSISVSLPCVAGPHTSVSAKLSLISNKYRKNTNPDNLAGTGYAEDPGNDERFTYNVGTIQSIATSEAQQDNGLFELNFKDDRYLPFEGTGAVSSWRLELPNKELAQFSYDTIADLVLHINFTAREGGSSLRGLAETTLLDRLAELKQELSQTGLHTAINIKHEMPNEWHLLKSTGSVESIISKDRLPYLAQALDATIENTVVLAKVTGNPANFVLKVDGSDLNLSRIDAWKLCKGETTDLTLDTPVVLSLTPANLTKLEELVLVVKYGF
ncbi:MAG TPA: neuraminidase-like domain-containing protein [Candidatus Saccharimonadales bacterium]|nr:neuraminidase-like domain-containing protein [Candidatus Saccharimonadales bacterium]